MSGYKTEQWFIEFLWRQPREDREGYLGPYRSERCEFIRRAGVAWPVPTTQVRRAIDAWAENCAASSRDGVPLADILGIEE